jgi:cell division septation protein DedD
VVNGGTTSTTSTTDQDGPLAVIPSTTKPAATPANSDNSPALTPQAADDGKSVMIFVVSLLTLEHLQQVRQMYLAPLLYPLLPITTQWISFWLLQLIKL